MTAAQIEQHYKDYYHPANMRLFVAGKFNTQQVERLLNKTWALIPPNPLGKTIPPIGKPKPNPHPYIRTLVTSDHLWITYGTKVWDLTRLDEEILVQMLPFKIQEILMALTFIFMFHPIEYHLIQKSYFKIPFIHQSLFFAQYLPMAIRFLFYVTTIHLGFIFIARQIYIVGDTFIIKTLTYYSYLIPLTDIAKVELCSPHSLSVSQRRRIRMRLKFRAQIYAPQKTWLLIELKNGKCWAFGVSNPELAAKEINSILNELHSRLPLGHLTSESSQHPLKRAGSA